MSTLILKSNTFVKAALNTSENYNTQVLDEKVGFKQIVGGKADVQAAVNAALINGSTQMVLTDFLRKATKVDIKTFVTDLNTQALLLGFDDKFVIKQIDSLLGIVSKLRAQFGKDKTFLPFEDEKSCLRKVRGSYELEWAAWSDNSWVNKAKYAAANEAEESEDEDGEASTGTGTESTKTNKVDALFGAASTLSIEELEELTEKLTALLTERKVA